MSEHFVLGKDLGRMGGGHAKQFPQQGGLVQRVQLQHAARDVGLDERIDDVPGPLRFVGCIGFSYFMSSNQHNHEKDVYFTQSLSNNTHWVRITGQRRPAEASPFDRVSP
ncbi:MAG: hypothetical protein EOM10_09320 [Opitutae bacterium]|nr:hypothetical protein [Opitutae bacterium]